MTAPDGLTVDEALAVLRLVPECARALTTELERLRTIDQQRRQDRLLSAGEPHAYLSTACQHALHSDCRRDCKFCSEPCRCDCHRGAEVPAIVPTPPAADSPSEYMAVPR